MKSKKVGEIFKDYNTESIIKNAEVCGLNVSKKENSLGIILKSSKYLEVKDIWYLEKFLMERFKFSNVDMVIKYEKDTEIKPIDKEWENIICYVSHKYPIAKNMLFKKSDIEIEKDTIHVKMHIPGVDFLKAKKADIEIENIIEKLYGKKYKINLIEQISEEELQEIKEEKQKTQKRAIERLMEEVVTRAPSKEETKEQQEVKETKIEKEEVIQNEKTPLILGRNANIKEQLVKIEELTIEDRKSSFIRRYIKCRCKRAKVWKNVVNF